MCIYCGAAQDMAWDIAGVRQPPPPLLHLCVSDERELPQPPHVGRHHLALHTARGGGWGEAATATSTKGHELMATWERGNRKQGRRAGLARRPQRQPEQVVAPRHRGQAAAVSN